MFPQVAALRGGTVNYVGFTELFANQQKKL